MSCRCACGSGDRVVGQWAPLPPVEHVVSPSVVEYVTTHVVAPGSPASVAENVSNGFAYANVLSDPGTPEAAASMEWVAEPDGDEPEPITLTIDLDTYGGLLAKARAYDALLAKGNPA